MGLLKKTLAVRDSRITIVVVVVLAMVLDDMLLTIIVPILPVVFLDECHSSNASAPLGSGASAHGEGLVVDNVVFTECEEAVNQKLGYLMGSQFVIRIAMSFFGSYMCNKLGYYMMMLIGCFLMIASTLVYAFAESYVLYFVGRLIHGLAAVPNDVGGLGLLAFRFRDNEEMRGFVLGLAFCGYGVGAIIGPSFGGVISQYLGTTAPFLCLTGLLVLLALAEVSIYNCEKTEHKEDPLSAFKLLLDPQILIAAGATTIVSLVFGLLEPSLPVWMITTMDAEKWQLGVVFLPSSVAYVLSCSLFGYLGHRIGRWLCIILSLAGVAICTAVLPFAGSFTAILPVMALFGLCFGAMDASTCAVINYLVDKRHQEAYGGVATLTVITFSFGLAVGPALSASLINLIGFPWLLHGLGIMTAIFAPLALYLRRSEMAPSCDKEEEISLVHPPK